jgi:hypothetical protein
MGNVEAFEEISASRMPMTPDRAPFVGLFVVCARHQQ